MLKYELLVLLALALACGGKDDTNETAADTETDTEPVDTGPDDPEAESCWAAMIDGGQPVNESGELTEDYGVYWVCPGTSLTVTGSWAWFYVDAGATLTLNGNNSKIWAKSGSTIILNGESNGLTYEPGTIITDNGDNYRNWCTAITIETTGSC